MKRLIIAAVAVGLAVISNIYSVETARAEGNFKAASPGMTLVWQKIGADDSTNVVIGASDGTKVTWTSVNAGLKMHQSAGVKMHHLM